MVPILFIITLSVIYIVANATSIDVREQKMITKWLNEDYFSYSMEDEEEIILYFKMYYGHRAIDYDLYQVVKNGEILTYVTSDGCYKYKTTLKPNKKNLALFNKLYEKDKAWRNIIKGRKL